MANSKGIHKSSIFKLGKALPQRDKHNLKLAAILKPRPAPPKEYDFDLTHPGTPTPMFANDTYGDCVIAGRAHQTLRFELVEQGKQIHISDQAVLKEYLKESEGVDSGLVVLTSLKLWRTRGWRVGKNTYKIEVFAEIDRTNPIEVKRSAFMDIGVGLGLALPLTAKTQIDAGKPWDVVSGAGSAANSWGGHYVYVPGYTKRGPVCITWGRKQQMTWSFFAKYCDEAYAIIDAVETAKTKKAINVKTLDAFLATV